MSAALPAPTSRYKYQVWQDSRLGRQKMVRDGLETVLTLVPVNRMFEVFPAYDKLICWEDEIHGGTGPTLAGPPAAASPTTARADAEQQQQQQQAAEAERWSGEDMAASRPLAQQRRRLRGSEVDEDENEQQLQGGPYLFDYEKKPVKLLAFVSMGGRGVRRVLLASFPVGCGGHGCRGLACAWCQLLPNAHHLHTWLPHCHACALPPALPSQSGCTAQHAITAARPPSTRPSLPPCLGPWQVLPDLSEERWQYAGTEIFKETGETARVWEWDLTGRLGDVCHSCMGHLPLGWLDADGTTTAWENSKPKLLKLCQKVHGCPMCTASAEGGASEMKYRFYATRDGVPLRLWMMGTNLYSGGDRLQITSG